MRQALIALTLSLGLLTFPTSALADSDNSHKHKKFSDHKYQHDRAIQDLRQERREHKKRIHRKRHRIEKYRHYSGHNYNKWKARRHYYAYSHRNHHRGHNFHHRHGLKHSYHSHRHHSHRSHHDSDYLEWLGIMLLLDEALEDDYR